MQVGEDAELSTSLFTEQVDGNSIQVDEKILYSGKSYYWNVDGLNENGESLAGPSKSALIVMPSTDNIPLISPIEKVEVDNLNPLLKWGSLLGTSSYTIKLSKDSGFESNLIEEIVSGTDYAIPESNRLQNSTAYFWQAEGATEEKVVTSSLGNFTTPTSASLTIQKLEDEESISISNPIFSWDAVEGVSSYSIRFADNSDFSDSREFKTGAASFEYPGTPSLEFGVPYFWQVSPLNNEGSAIGGWTSARSFTINAAFIVQLELPATGEAVAISNPTFKWGAIEGISKYEIQVSSGEDFSELLWSSAEIVENSTVYPGSGAEPLGYGQIYYWHVRTMGEAGPLGNFSSPFSFELSGDNKVKLEGPLNEESESLTPYFSWIAVRSVIMYTLNLASDASMATLIYSTDSKEVFFQYPGEAPPLGNGTTYYWNVIAKDENGSPIGDASNVGSFKTPAGFIEIEFIYGSGK